MRGDNGNGDWESFTIRLLYLFNLFSNLLEKRGLSNTLELCY